LARPRSWAGSAAVIPDVFMTRCYDVRPATALPVRQPRHAFHGSNARIQDFYRTVMGARRCQGPYVSR